MTNREAVLSLAKRYFIQSKESSDFDNDVLINQVKVPVAPAFSSFTVSYIVQKKLFSRFAPCQVNPHAKADAEWCAKWSQDLRLFGESLTPHVNSGRVPDRENYKGHSVDEETLRKGDIWYGWINAQKYHVLARIRLLSQSANLVRRALKFEACHSRILLDERRRGPGRLPE